MEHMKLHVVTPEGSVFSGEIRSVIVRTTEGDVGILKNHTNMVAAIAYGMLKITAPDGTARIAACMNGFVSVEAEKVRIIATTFEFADDLDLARAQRAKEESQNRLADPALTDDERALAESRLRRAENRIRVYELNQ
ncbi:MAG: ATP synthase F1 subunit epsilon [Clostridia bacterium]|nr:ATP synthase F1 subunit epsilon [Clostridia bacterium]